MKKKALMFFVVVVLSGVLAACGGSGAEDLEDADEQVSEEVQEEVQEETDTAEEPEDEKVNPDDITYVSYEADEIILDMYEDLAAAQEKYGDQYVEITGILEEAEVDDMANPPGKIVRLKTMVDSSEPNEWAEITAYSWDDKWMTLEEFEESIADLSEGDPVVLRAYISGGEYGDIDDGLGIKECAPELIGIRKQ